jgi:hypothetical protein
VRVSGRVTHSADGWFYLDDGSGTDDGSGHTGIRVLLWSGSSPAAGEFVRVTGVSSAIRIGGSIRRLLRVAAPSDIQTVQAAP